MDAAVVQAVVAAIGPAGVIVLSALWILARRRENGRTPPRGPFNSSENR